MRNLQKNLNIIWQPLISRQPPPPAPILPNPPFLAKFSDPPPPISINFEKVETPLIPPYEGERRGKGGEGGGGVEL